MKLCKWKRLSAIAFGLACAVTMCVQSRGHSALAAPTTEAQDYSKFSHSTPREHADLMARNNCGSCHRRGENAIVPRFPIHKDCTSCHLVQFTASNRSSSVNPICTICHTRDGLNSSNAPTRSFPRLLSFAAEFDHAQHLQEKESARPSGGCISCHVPTRRGVAQAIPAGLGAHQICYQCHSPEKSAAGFSSCGSCHRLSAYSPTSISARAFSLSFSHGDHGSRAGLNCQSCHNVKGRGLGQGRQIGSTVAIQHLINRGGQTCKSCHNERLAFGDTDTHDCKRCHRRDGFRMTE